MGAATVTVTSEGGSRALGSSGAIVEGSLSGTAKDRGSRLGPKSPRVAFICLSCRQVGMKSIISVNMLGPTVLLRSLLALRSRQIDESSEWHSHLRGQL
jgi:hypothetical protein